MTPPIFTIAAANAEVTARLGESPTRLYPFGMAPRKGTPSFGTPYAVWQQITGLPENYLGQRPDGDSVTLQVDIYSDSVDSVRATRDALSYAIEPHAHVTRWGTEEIDRDTGLYRAGFDIDWIVIR